MNRRPRSPATQLDLVVLGVAVALLCGSSAGSHAAVQGPPPAPQAQQSFRTGTVVIEVDAIVTDAEGRFVPGLGADDFEVLEDGKPQRLQSLYVVTTEGVTLLPAPSAAPTQPSTVATPPPPGAGRLFILFFDEQHIDPGAFKRLQAAAEDFLQSEFREGDVGGVLVGTRMAGNRLTGKREELVAAVKEAKPSASRGMLKLDLQDWPRITQVEAIRIAVDNDQNILRQVVQRAEREAPGGRQVPDYTPNVLEKARYILAQLRVPARNTLTAFAGLVNGLARLPGRKTVVFMTDGFYIEEAGDAVRQIVGAAARANIRVYSIDAQGQNRRQQDTSLNALMPMETGGAIPAGAYDTTEDGPNSLAVDTGGMAIRNTNDFRSALSRVARDTSQYLRPRLRPGQHEHRREVPKHHGSREAAGAAGEGPQGIRRIAGCRRKRGAETGCDGPSGPARRDDRRSSRCRGTRRPCSRYGGRRANSDEGAGRAARRQHSGRPDDEARRAQAGRDTGWRRPRSGAGVGDLCLPGVGIGTRRVTWRERRSSSDKRPRNPAARRGCPTRSASRRSAWAALPTLSRPGNASAPRSPSSETCGSTSWTRSCGWTM